MGLGRSGQAAARLALRQGAKVVGIDLRSELNWLEGEPPGLVVELGPHRDEVFDQTDLIVVSPGIPPRQPQVAAAIGRGIPVVGELGFASSFLDAPIIAVTGTNGKSTVTWFVHQLLRHAGLHTFAGGNLGNPLSNAALSSRPFDCLVVEVSSYQLELPGTFHPDVGVILNLTPDHLARHRTMEAYGAAKARLFERMDDQQWAFLPPGDSILAHAASAHGGRRAWLGGFPGVVRNGRTAQLRLGHHDVQLSLADVALPGGHNLDNAAWAAALVLAWGMSADAVQDGLGRLRPLAHRMEVVAEARGVRWINDSKATNIAAARAGVAGLDDVAVVLLGGEGKPNPDGSLGFAELAPHLARHRGVVAFGAAGPTISAELTTAGISCQLAEGLAQAVDIARSMVRRGEVVLLSPGCASFDEFEDFEHRGHVFSELAQMEGV